MIDDNEYNLCRPGVLSQTQIPRAGLNILGISDTLRQLQELITKINATRREKLVNKKKIEDFISDKLYDDQIVVPITKEQYDVILQSTFRKIGSRLAVFRCSKGIFRRTEKYDLIDFAQFVFDEQLLLEHVRLPVTDTHQQNCIVVVKYRYLLDTLNGLSNGCCFTSAPVRHASQLIPSWLALKPMATFGQIVAGILESRIFTLWKHSLSCIDTDSINCDICSFRIENVVARTMSEFESYLCSDVPSKQHAVHISHCASEATRTGMLRKLDPEKIKLIGKLCPPIFHFPTYNMAAKINVECLRLLLLAHINAQATKPKQSLFNDPDTQLHFALDAISIPIAALATPLHEWKAEYCKRLIDYLHKLRCARVVQAIGTHSSAEGRRKPRNNNKKKKSSKTKHSRNLCPNHDESRQSIPKSDSPRCASSTTTSTTTAAIGIAIATTAAGPAELVMELNMGIKTSEVTKEHIYITRSLIMVGEIVEALIDTVLCSAAFEVLFKQKSNRDLDLASIAADWIPLIAMCEAQDTRSVVEGTPYLLSDNDIANALDYLAVFGLDPEAISSSATTISLAIPSSSSSSTSSSSSSSSLSSSASLDQNSTVTVDIPSTSELDRWTRILSSDLQVSPADLNSPGFGGLWSKYFDYEPFASTSKVPARFSSAITLLDGEETSQVSKTTDGNSANDSFEGSNKNAETDSLLNECFSPLPKSESAFENEFEASNSFVNSPKSSHVELQDLSDATPSVSSESDAVSSKVLKDVSSTEDFYDTSQGSIALVEPSPPDVIVLYSRIDGLSRANNLMQIRLLLSETNRSVLINQDSVYRSILLGMQGLDSNQRYVEMMPLISEESTLVTSATPHRASAMQYLNNSSASSSHNSMPQLLSLALPTSAPINFGSNLNHIEAMSEDGDREREYFPHRTQMLRRSTLDGGPHNISPLISSGHDLAMPSGSIHRYGQLSMDALLPLKPLQAQPSNSKSLASGASVNSIGELHVSISQEISLGSAVSVSTPSSPNRMGSNRSLNSPPPPVRITPPLPADKDQQQPSQIHSTVPSLGASQVAVSDRISKKPPNPGLVKRHSFIAVIGQPSSLPKLSPRANILAPSVASFLANMKPKLLKENISSRLSEEIVEFVAKIDDIESNNYIAKMSAFDRLRIVVHNLWPRAQVKLFGSFVSHLSLPSSDLDMVICLPKVHWEAGPEAPGFLEGRNAIKETWQQNLARALRKEPWVIASSIKIIGNTAIPVLKLRTKDDGLQCPSLSLDVSFEGQGHRGLEANKYIAALMINHATLRPLVLVLKYFLTKKSLCESFTGGLSSYALLLMMVRFLQEITAPPSDSHIEPVNDLGAQLLGFLSFFGSRFDPRQTGISVKRRCYFSRSLGNSLGYNSRPSYGPEPTLSHVGSSLRRPNHFPLGKTNSYNSSATPSSNSATSHSIGTSFPFKFDPLFIEDPLERNNNVGRNCFRVFQVLRVFSDAYNHCRTSLKIAEERENSDSLQFSLLSELIGNISDLSS